MSEQCPHTVQISFSQGWYCPDCGAEWHENGAASSVVFVCEEETDE